MGLLCLSQARKKDCPVLYLVRVKMVMAVSLSDDAAAVSALG